MKYWGLTDKGIVRNQNQDSFFTGLIDNETGKESVLCAVCDGMGGVKGGNLASAVAIDSFVSVIKEGIGAKAEVEAVMRTAVKTANTAVRLQAEQNPELKGMGTTLVSAFAYEDKAEVVNVGDSRCYLISNHEIKQVTKDHSLVENMVDSGEIRRDQAWRHPQKNLITRAIGTEDEVECDLFNIGFCAGDFLLLCSDGLSNIVNAQEMLFEVLYGDSEDSAAQRMMDIALGRNAPDNVTVVLLAK